MINNPYQPFEPIKTGCFFPKINKIFPHKYLLLPLSNRIVRKALPNMGTEVLIMEKRKKRDLKYPKTRLFYHDLPETPKYLKLHKKNIFSEPY